MFFTFILNKKGYHSYFTTKKMLYLLFCKLWAEKRLLYRPTSEKKNTRTKSRLWPPVWRRYLVRMSQSFPLHCVVFLLNFVTNNIVYVIWRPHSERRHSKRRWKRWATNSKRYAHSWQIYQALGRVCFYLFLYSFFIVFPVVYLFAQKLLKEATIIMA